MADECETHPPSSQCRGAITPDQKPFTPETLAERWGCSANKVRQMVKSGELAGFRLGKLIRVPAIEVERYECEETEAETMAAIKSSRIEESLPSRSDAARIAGDTRRVLTTRAWRA
jgi:excisionase family DNA binding protein